VGAKADVSAKADTEASATVPAGTVPGAAVRAEPGGGNRSTGKRRAGRIADRSGRISDRSAGRIGDRSGRSADRSAERNASRSAGRRSPEESPGSVAKFAAVCG
jgi:hypothetical protein